MRPCKNDKKFPAVPAGATDLRLALLLVLLLLFTYPASSAEELAAPAVVQGHEWALYDVSSIRNFPYCLAYRNGGYSLEIRGTDPVSRRVLVRIEPGDLDCRAVFPPDPGAWPPEAAAYTGSPGTFPELTEHSRSLTSGCRTQYQAVNQVLCWLSGTIEYRSGPGIPPEPLEVLRKGRANCVGAAELAVALLREAGIPARGVRGFLAPLSASGTSSPDASVEMSLGEEGLHRWIEVYYPEAGWVFSDPFRSVNHVSPRYLVFALESPPETGATGPGHGGPVPAKFQRLRPEMDDSVSTFIRLLDRGGLLVPTDVVPSLRARAGMTVRRNSPVQFRPALVGFVTLAPACGLPSPDTVCLFPAGPRNDQPAAGQRTAAIRNGLFSFTDLQTGEYRLHFFSNGRAVGSERAVVHFPPQRSGVVPIVLGR